MALQRVLRRVITPGNNVLLLCRAQSTGSAAVGILFNEESSDMFLLCKTLIFTLISLYILKFVHLNDRSLLVES